MLGEAIFLVYMYCIS